MHKKIIHSVDTRSVAHRDRMRTVGKFGLVGLVGRVGEQADGTPENG